MGDYVDEHGEGRNLTPGGLRRVGERLENQPTIQIGTILHEEMKRLVNEDSKDNDIRQKVTEGKDPINLLCVYTHGVKPNVIHLYSKKDVDTFLADRGNHNLPVYELHIVLNATTGSTSVEIGDRLENPQK